MAENAAPAAGTPAATPTTPTPAQAPPAAGAGAQGTGGYQPAGFRGVATGDAIGGGTTAPEAPTAPATEEPPKPRARVIGQGGVIPEERITERIARERRKLLREEYGTDDPVKVEQIRQDRKQHAEAVSKYRAAEEEAQRAAMTEQERLKADLAKREERIAELEAANRELQETSAVEKQDAVISRVAASKVNPKFLRFAKIELADHLTGLSPEEQAKFDEKKLAKWFDSFVADNPEFKAVVGASAEPAPVVKVELAKPPPKRVPITNGAGPRRGPPATTVPAADPLAGKTPVPGKPNSMSDKEYADYKKSRRIST
jgi:hypothetical protein